MKNVIERIDSEIEGRSLLKHPFYQMWSEGKLTLDHLRGYSKEYFQLVKAVPEFVENISALTADPSIEESEHIEQWIRFAGAIGIPRKELVNYIATDKTNDAISDLTHITSLSRTSG